MSLLPDWGPKSRGLRHRPCVGPKSTGSLLQPKILVSLGRNTKFLASLYRCEPYHHLKVISQPKWVANTISFYLPWDTEWVSGKTNHNSPICQSGTESVSWKQFLLIDVKYTCKHSSLFYQSILLKVIYKKTLLSLQNN